MLKLAGASEDDIFCDLGCGLAQNLIIAASEFDVRKAVGFERNEKRFKKAERRIRLKGLENQCKVIQESYQKALDGKSKEFRLEDATIVFYGLGTDTELLELLEKKLSEGCRLVYYNLCLFPEIMPDDIDFPFYVSRFPFTNTISEFEWLRKIVCKEKSLVQKGRKPSLSELWDELSHDYKISSTILLIQLKTIRKGWQSTLR